MGEITWPDGSGRVSVGPKSSSSSPDTHYSHYSHYSDHYMTRDGFGSASSSAPSSPTLSAAGTFGIGGAPAPPSWMNWSKPAVQTVVPISPIVPKVAVPAPVPVPPRRAPNSHGLGSAGEWTVRSTSPEPIATPIRASGTVFRAHAAAFKPANPGLSIRDPKDSQPKGHRAPAHGYTGGRRHTHPEPLHAEHKHADERHRHSAPPGSIVYSRGNRTPTMDTSGRPTPTWTPRTPTHSPPTSRTPPVQGREYHDAAVRARALHGRGPSPVSSEVVLRSGMSVSELKRITEARLLSRVSGVGTIKLSVEPHPVTLNDSCTGTTPSGQAIQFTAGVANIPVEAHDPNECGECLSRCRM